jgi:hypothetical protein
MYVPERIARFYLIAAARVIYIRGGRFSKPMQKLKCLKACMSKTEENAASKKVSGGYNCLRIKSPNGVW